MELHVVLSGVKAEERAESSEKLPELQHVCVPQLRLVPEGTVRVHQVTTRSWNLTSVNTLC